MFAISFPDNPIAPALFNQLQAGLSINTGVLDLMSGGLDKLGSILGGLESLADVPVVPPVVTDAIEAVTQFGTCLTDAATHTAQQFRDLPSNLHMMAVSKEIRSTVSSWPTGDTASTMAVSTAEAKAAASADDENTPADFCSDIQDFFSSVMGGMDAILNAILGVGGLLDRLQQAVADGLAAIGRIIGEVISKFTKAISDVMAMIDRELAALASALKDLLEFSFLNSFLTLFKHPCARLVMQAAGTAGFIGLLAS